MEERFLFTVTADGKPIDDEGDPILDPYDSGDALYIGNEDDGIYIDFAVLEGGWFDLYGDGDNKWSDSWVAFEAVCNSETGCFIDTFTREISPSDEALDVADVIVRMAHNWIAENNVRHPNGKLVRNQKEVDQFMSRLRKAISG